MSIEEIYAKVITGNHYDLSIANEHTMMLISKHTIKAKEMPKIEADFVRKNHTGCCLHFSMYLIYLLKEANIECYLTTTPEKDGAMHASVLYYDGSKYLIADPVADIINGTVNKNTALDYNEFAQNAIDNSIKHFDLGEYGDKLFFSDFLHYPMKFQKDN